MAQPRGSRSSRSNTNSDKLVTASGTTAARRQADLIDEEAQGVGLVVVEEDIVVLPAEAEDRGPKGPTGLPGERGEQGDKGPRGPSALPANAATRATRVLAAKPACGERGEQGPQGPVGLPANAARA